MLKAFVARRQCLRRNWGWEGHCNRKRKWWWCFWGKERQNMKAECWRNKQWLSRDICNTHRHTHVVGMVAIYVFFVWVLWAPTHEPTYLSLLTSALCEGDIGSPTSIWSTPVQYVLVHVFSCTQFYRNFFSFVSSCSQKTQALLFLVWIICPYI